MSNQPIVTFEKIHKYFETNHILKGIDLEIMPREKVALIGPSGSGKTTLIRMLMTLEKPSSGTIYVNGENVWQRRLSNQWIPADEKHLRKIRENIGMVFQHFHLFPHMTALENCMTALIHVKKLKKDVAKKLAVKMLERVGLHAHMHQYPNSLSGGQKQRVAIARALVLNPKIMLFDEVTSALDPELVGEVLEVIRHIAATEDMAMILVTHEMDFARDIADRVVFMDEGIIQASGTPEEIFHHSGNKRLQTFLSRFQYQ